MLLFFIFFYFLMVDATYLSDMFNLLDLPCSVDHVLGIDTSGVQLYIESNDYYTQCVLCTQAEIMF